MIKDFDNNNMRNVQMIATDLRRGIVKSMLQFPFLRAFADESILSRHWDELFRAEV